MAFVGYVKYQGQDVPAFESLLDVPAFYYPQHRRFALVRANLPADVQASGVGSAWGIHEASPGIWLIIGVALILTAIAVILATLVIIPILEAAATLFHGYPAQEISPGVIRDGCGCIYTKDPTTAKLTAVDPSCSCFNPSNLIGLLLAGAVGIGAIVAGAWYFRRQFGRKPA